MALSPPPQAASYRDPYELDRLADELASRELSSRNPGHNDVSELNGHVLPEYVPLSHNDKYLTAESFEVDQFLLARAHVPLPDLRTELRQYLAQLKEELVKLINDDYEDFISLSTDLRDEGIRMERIKHPLGDLKAKIVESKQELLTIQNAIHGKLSKRNTLREEKALLHLLLKISESVSRLESLLHISSPDSESKEDTQIDRSKYAMFSQQTDTLSDSLMTNRAKHLGRVAMEYAQLVYHTKKAQEAKCLFVNEVQWRVDRVHSTLSSDLDQLFAEVVISLTDPKGENRGTELERSKWIADLTESLRTYENLGLWRDAEDILSREVMRVFVKKTIYPGALAAPHSPIVPHTPFQKSLAEPKTASGPQIPYTPFTAFIPKQSTSKTPDSSSELPQANLLEDQDDPLAKLYNQILRFVEKDMVRIMDIAEKTSVKSHSEDNDNLVPPSNKLSNEDAQQGFKIMSNVVWAELGRAIMDEIGNIIFSAGRPNEFRKNYETTQSFIRSLEMMAPSLQAVQSMRQHPAFVNFERRWQLPVYFQLRWKEIVVGLEETLSTTKSDPNPSKGRFMYSIENHLSNQAQEKGTFKTLQAASIWLAISSCWSSEVFIPELGHRFWKLTLQILARYRKWLEEYLILLDSPSNPAPTVHRDSINQSNSARVSTPSNTDVVSSTESIAADDNLLREYAYTIIDLRILESNVLNIWRQVIYVLLPESVDDDDDFRAEDALRESLRGLASLGDPLSSKITGILTKRCCEALSALRGIPSQFRTMSNKRAPTEPSYFVPLILRPIKQFFAIGVADGPGYLLKDALLKAYSTEVFNHVTQRYISHLTAMKKQKESLRRLKKGPFSLFGTSSTDEDRDEERIRNQMVLDAEAYAADAESLLVQAHTNEHWLSLKDLVYSTSNDSSF